MKLGNNKNIFLILFFFSFNYSFSDDKITSIPLINLEKIKPSFEELNEDSEISTNNENIKEKNQSKIFKKSPYAVLIGLDKITAKSSEMIVNINETKKFGPLEIKILKCGKINLNNRIDDVAYMQVKDLSKSENEKVFIFNGWTFASDPTLTPFDHAIYDIQLVNCNNA